jgi:hypothetical protein
MATGASRIDSLLDRLRAYAQQAARRGLALDRVKITSPFAENRKYSAYSAFVLIPAHKRRHLWQAEQALRS